VWLRVGGNLKHYHPATLVCILSVEETQPTEKALANTKRLATYLTAVFKGLPENKPTKAYGDFVAKINLLIAQLKPNEELIVSLVPWVAMQRLHLGVKTQTLDGDVTQHEPVELCLVDAQSCKKRIERRLRAVGYKPSEMLINRLRAISGIGELVIHYRHFTHRTNRELFLHAANEGVSTYMTRVRKNK
jgi:hypothetical protein